MREGMGFLLIYSITSRPSFERIKDLREKIKWTKDTDFPPVVLVANKCDLESERKVSQQESQELAESWECPLIETSAKTAHNVELCIRSILGEVAKYVDV
eukprot:TRINITY_DN3366_c0_g1_i1.p2 TRINITY_DN3366_c0_g1~~TRINITY_DN3366_c0_g1_i1.p2  ORF type:complete len:100 (-),score=8.65 TRINITY_DN3366_c0_g1_i1:51-350(-)